MLKGYIKFYKLIITILEPIEQSNILLEKIDAKLDSQKMSELKGQFRSLQRLYGSGDLDKTALNNCLSSLTVSNEYFKTMGAKTFKALLKEEKNVEVRIRKF